MQITSTTLTAGAYMVPKTTIPEPADASSSIEATGTSTLKTVDFSNITPRQLHAYLDKMIMSGRIDGLDCSTLFGSIPGEWYTERPDVPMDLTSEIKGVMEFARDNGFGPLAAYYAGLTDRMKLMEAQGLPISVVA